MIYYRDGYRYQLAESYVIQTPLHAQRVIQTQFLRLEKDGMLHILSGYAWDGPTGIWFFTKKLMRASLVRDALYQLLGQKLIRKLERAMVDELYRSISLEDGVWSVRAWWQHRAVYRLADPRNRKKTKTAP